MIDLENIHGSVMEGVEMLVRHPDPDGLCRSVTTVTGGDVSLASVAGIRPGTKKDGCFRRQGGGWNCRGILISATPYWNSNRAVAQLPVKFD